MFQLTLSSFQTKRPTYQVNYSLVRSLNLLKLLFKILPCLEMGWSYKTLEVPRDPLSLGCRVGLQVIAYCDTNTLCPKYTSPVKVS